MKIMLKGAEVTDVTSATLTIGHVDENNKPVLDADGNQVKDVMYIQNMSGNITLEIS